MNKNLEKALNDQINAEFYSGYLYLAMSAYFEEQNMTGFAGWMYVQYQEEITHAVKFFRYVLERGGSVTLDTIAKPATDWKNAEEVFAEVVKHEHYVTGLINKLVDLAIAEKDHATNNMLQWFVAEQVEEEANVAQIFGQIKMVQESKQGLYMLNKELGLRVFVDATAKPTA
ncbi:ferritin [bacterium]|nr:ferritin [bacterium]